MLILRSHGFGFADVGLAETSCRFSDAVSVCLTSDFGDLVSSPFRCLPLCPLWRFGFGMSARRRGRFSCRMKIFDDPKNRCGLSIIKRLMVAPLLICGCRSDLILQRQMVARCSETAFGCHTFGIAFRVTTFLPWRGGCRTFADVSRH